MKNFIPTKNCRMRPFERRGRKGDGATKEGRYREEDAGEKMKEVK
jgi:hypothetical protein